MFDLIFGHDGGLVLVLVLYLAKCSDIVMVELVEAFLCVLVCWVCGSVLYMGLLIHCDSNWVWFKWKVISLMSTRISNSLSNRYSVLAIGVLHMLDI